MKLILTQEVSGLGGPGDVVEVKGGYGRNYLLPRRLAIPWTKGSQKQVDSIRRARSAREIRDINQAQTIKEQLESMTVRLSARAGETGRLFGSVTPSDIVAAVKDAGGPELDRRRIEIRTPIKSVGSHQASVRLHADLTATISLEVVPAS
ncbi:MAG TPA: 50S ribosomal protein L9 [Actinopolymorphaceae bacterium]|jgi:large subunit ribosomal protein L9